MNITVFKFGKPSISMGYLYHGYVSHDQAGYIISIRFPFRISICAFAALESPSEQKAGQAQVEFRVTPTRLPDPQGLEIDVDMVKMAWEMKV